VVDVYKKGTGPLTKTIKDRDAKKVEGPHGHLTIYYNVSFLQEPIMQSLIEHLPQYSLPFIYDQTWCQWRGQWFLYSLSSSPWERLLVNCISGLSILWQSLNPPGHVNILCLIEVLMLKMPKPQEVLPWCWSPAHSLGSICRKSYL